MEKHGVPYLKAILLPELQAAVAEGHSPDFSIAGSASWSAVLDVLVVEGDLEPVRHAARHFHAAFPKSTYARTLRDVFERLPPPDASSPFDDDLEKDFQLVERKGADTLLLVFCDAGHRLGIPLTVAHRWLGRLPASLAYLRDFRRVLFLGGVPSLGREQPATAAALRDIAASLGARRIVCVGNSGGTFAALKYALDVRAQGVLGITGPTNLSPQFTEYLRPVMLAGRADRLALSAEIDLRGAYRSAESPPHVVLTYGANNWDDRIQAEYLADLPNVVLRPIPGLQSHSAVTELIRRDEFATLLGEVVSQPGA